MLKQSQNKGLATCAGVFFGAFAGCIPGIFIGAWIGDRPHHGDGGIGAPLGGIAGMIGGA
jgi:hypothetical protein